MADSFSWVCPYCGQAATITDENLSSETHGFNNGNRDGQLGVYTVVVVCPNDKCRRYAISARLDHVHWKGGWEPIGEPMEEWRLMPRSRAQAFPDYVPQAVVRDYEEACLIQDLSPKASATLSRRCLQGIIRDFWKIKKSRLIDEISELQGKVDGTTWKAIDAVRSIGNIGAHMEKDIDVIVEVEPKEAELLTGLIETLLRDWYIARHDREEHLKSIIDVAESKKDSNMVPQRRLLPRAGWESRWTGKSVAGPGFPATLLRSRAASGSPRIDRNEAVRGSHEMGQRSCRATGSWGGSFVGG